MIATPTWINANSAMEYHTESKDNYYQKEGDLGEWQGKGAEALGFSGTVTENELKKALWGKDAEGNQLVGARLDKDGDRKRSGLDLTFNAPKSVSLAMELSSATGNKELAKAIMTAHEKAVEKGIDNFERLIQTRETIDGNTSKYRSGNIAVAKFTHSVARPVTDETGKTTVDPSLHTHAVVMNVTQAKDGSFKAIETGDIFKEYIKVGAQYRMELANNLKELGFDIRVTNQNQAFFEIDLKTNNDDKLLDEFSKRSQQLNDKELIAELKSKYPNKNNSEIKQMAAYHSREWKGEIDREAVQKDNLQRAEALGFDKEINLQADKINSISHADQREKADTYINNAIYALSEEKSVFSRNDIVEMSSKMAMQESISPSLIESVLDETKELIDLKDDKYTTKEILSAEHDLIESVKSSKTIKQPYLKREAKELVTEYSSKEKEKTGYSLTDGQQKATTHILSNKNQVIGIQGDAGVGKTTMLKALNELKTDDTNIIGLSYTGKAANEIELKTSIKSKEVFKSAGIESSTVASFLNKYEKGYLELDGNKDLKIVVDEASMLGTKDAAKLTAIVQETNAQLVLIGDEKQFKAINAGDPFTLLKNHADMKTIDMNEVLRQKDQTLKSAVWALNQYDSKKAFEVLDKKDLIQETDKGVTDVLKEYFKTDGDDRLAVVAGKESYKDNIILTNTNKTKDTINQEIRDRHQYLGNIDKENHTTTVKKSSNLSPSAQFLAQSYKDSSKVFLQADINENLKAGKEFDITSIDEKRNSITLNDEHEIDLKKHGKHLQAYSEKQLDFSKGDKVIFTKNDKKLGINNGESATIKDIDDKGNFTFNIDDKKQEVKFNIKEYNYLDHGYAITTMKSQGQTAKNVIAYMEAKNQNFNSFYVAATRAEESLKIFTDNKEQLKEFTQIEQVKYNATTLWEQLDKQEQQKLDKYRNNSKDNQPVRQVSDKQKDFAEKIAKELHVEFTGDSKDDIKNFIDTNLEKYNQSLKDAPASQKQLDFVNKIADTLYIDTSDNFSHKDAKEFISENINEFKDAMDDRHSHLLKVSPKDLSIEIQEKYYNDLVSKTGAEKDFNKGFELIQKYNEHNEVGVHEKMLQTDKLAQMLDIKGMDIANKVAENSFSKEYIEVWGLKDKPYEIAKHVNDFTTVKYQDAKEFAKLDLIEEKADEKFFIDFEEIDKKVQNGEILQDDDKLKDVLDTGTETSLYLQETKEEIEAHVSKEYLKEEFSEYIQGDNIYDASKLLDDNKKMFDEFDYDRFEKQLGDVMDRLLDDEVKDIEHQIERRDEVEHELMEDEKEQDLENNEKEIEDDKDNEISGRDGESREEYEYER
ncbi:MAG TPA: conjugative relaxase [Sulfurimonas autotrophica]|nr:conjugative relaxase [Sulfurimonas autotrophica]